MQSEEAFFSEQLLFHTIIIDEGLPSANRIESASVGDSMDAIFLRFGEGFRTGIVRNRVKRMAIVRPKRKRFHTQKARERESASSGDRMDAICLRFEAGFLTTDTVCKDTRVKGRAIGRCKTEEAAFHTQKRFVRLLPPQVIA